MSEFETKYESPAKLSSELPIRIQGESRALIWEDVFYAIDKILELYPREKPDEN